MLILFLGDEDGLLVEAAAVGPAKVVAVEFDGHFVGDSGAAGGRGIRGTGKQRIVVAMVS